MSSSIAQSPDQNKANTNMARREPMEVRKSLAREKTLPIDEKPELILIQQNSRPKPLYRVPSREKTLS